jgi:hypothetical protein
MAESGGTAIDNVSCLVPMEAVLSLEGALER